MPTPPLATKRWMRANTREPIAYFNLKVTVDARLLVLHAAQHFDSESRDGRLVDYTTGRLISRRSLEDSILADIHSHGTERMDWDYDDEKFEIAKREVLRLYPEWVEWIERVTP